MNNSPENHSHAPASNHRRNAGRGDVPLTAILTLACTLALALGGPGCSNDDCTCPPVLGSPKVVETYPNAGDTLVPVDTFITATFHEDMDSATISAGSFTLEGPTGPVTASVTYTGRTATLTPLVQLAGHSVYTARIDAGVTDADGIPMNVPYAWHFTTGVAYLFLWPDLEFTVRDTNLDGEPDELVGGGPPGRLLMAGEADSFEDRAVMEFSLAEIVHDAVLEAVIFPTLSEITAPDDAIHIEGWGFSGNGNGDLADFSIGHLIAAYDFPDGMHAGETFAFRMTETINAALASGATHVGFRLAVSGGPQIEIATTTGPMSASATRIGLIY